MFEILKLLFVYGVSIFLVLLGIFIIVIVSHFGFSLFSEDGYLFALLVYKFEGNNDKNLIPKPDNAMDYLLYKIVFKDQKDDMEVS